MSLAIWMALSSRRRLSLASEKYGGNKEGNRLAGERVNNLNSASHCMFLRQMCRYFSSHVYIYTLKRGCRLKKGSSHKEKPQTTSPGLILLLCGFLIHQLVFCVFALSPPYLKGFQSVRCKGKFKNIDIEFAASRGLIKLGEKSILSIFYLDKRLGKCGTLCEFAVTYCLHLHAECSALCSLMNGIGFTMSFGWSGQILRSSWSPSYILLFVLFWSWNFQKTSRISTITFPVPQNIPPYFELPTGYILPLEIP